MYHKLTPEEVKEAEVMDKKTELKICIYKYEESYSIQGETYSRNEFNTGSMMLSRSMHKEICNELDNKYEIVDTKIYCTYQELELVTKILNKHVIYYVKKTEEEKNKMIENEIENIKTIMKYIQLLKDKNKTDMIYLQNVTPKMYEFKNELPKIDKEILMNQLEPYNIDYTDNVLTNVISLEVNKCDIYQPNKAVYDLFDNYIVVLFNTVIMQCYVCKCNLNNMKEMCKIYTEFEIKLVLDHSDNLYDKTYKFFHKQKINIYKYFNEYTIDDKIREFKILHGVDDISNEKHQEDIMLKRHFTKLIDYYFDVTKNVDDKIDEDNFYNNVLSKFDIGKILYSNPYNIKNDFKGIHNLCKMMNDVYGINKERDGQSYCFRGIKLKSENLIRGYN